MRGQHGANQGSSQPVGHSCVDSPRRPREQQAPVERAHVGCADVGYLARHFTQTSLPYRDPGDVPAWGRRNGSLSLVVQPGMTIDANGNTRSIGYPYGTIPRHLLSWLST